MINYNFDFEQEYGRKLTFKEREYSAEGKKSRVLTTPYKKKNYNKVLKFWRKYPGKYWGIQT